MNSEEDRLSATLVHIDRLMEECLAILKDDESTSLARYFRVLSGERRESIKRALRHVRETLVRVVVDSRMTFPAPPCSDLRAVQANVLIAIVALEEFTKIPARAAPVAQELAELAESLRAGITRHTPLQLNQPSSGAKI
jgi:hypothetical protein